MKFKKQPHFNAKKIKCLTTGMVYDSCKEAAIEMGLIAERISAAAIKDLVYNGHRFEYLAKGK